MVVVAEQVREISDSSYAHRGRYPDEYNNREAHGSNFEPFEHRGQQMYGLPVSARFDLDRRAATAAQVERAERDLHHNDRVRVVRNPPNDPGPFRGVVTISPSGSGVHSVSGCMYHPVGRPAGFERAPIEPMDREGRQYIHRYEDDGARVYRVETWPPRDEDGEDLAQYESRFAVVRKPVVCKPIVQRPRHR